MSELWHEAADSNLVWRVCRAIKGECKRCPKSERHYDTDDCTRGCYLQAVECVNIVETGNPWRKTEDVKVPYTVIQPTLQPRIRELEEALAPFARVWRNIPEHLQNNLCGRIMFVSRNYPEFVDSIEAPDFRRAACVLEKSDVAS